MCHMKLKIDSFFTNHFLETMGQCVPIPQKLSGSDTRAAERVWRLCQAGRGASRRCGGRGEGQDGGRTQCSGETEEETNTGSSHRQRLAILVINSLWPGDAIWWYLSGSTLAQVMACCLTAPSHYPNQYWLTIGETQWQSSEGNLTRDTSSINYYSNLPGPNELTHWPLSDGEVILQVYFSN